MTGILQATVTGNVGIYVFTANVTTAVADTAGAQTALNTIKAWFVAGGATNIVASGLFVPQTTGLTA